VRRIADRLCTRTGWVSLAPGRLASRLVEHEDEFLPVKDEAHLVGSVTTFEGFLLDLPE